MTDASLFLTNALLFVGGGSAGTAGGIKVGTLAVLVAAVVAEARGDTDAGVFGRRIAPATVRQALAVIGLYLAVVGTATTLLLHLSGDRMADVLFEVISATATVGLSTGITPDLPPGGDWVLIVCMFLGRLGPVTVAGALALRERARLPAARDPPADRLRRPRASRHDRQRGLSRRSGWLRLHSFIRRG